MIFQQSSCNQPVNLGTTLIKLHGGCTLPHVDIVIVLETHDALVSFLDGCRRSWRVNCDKKLSIRRAALTIRAKKCLIAKAEIRRAALAIRDETFLIVRAEIY